MKNTWKWSLFRSYGNSFAVRATIIMPVIGYLLLLNEHVIDFSKIDPRFRIFASDQPWRLIFLYYGSFATGIAAAIYQLRCPIIVKKYDSAVEYVRAELDFFSDEDNYEYIRKRVRERFQKAPSRIRELEGVQHIEEKLAKIPKGEPGYKNHITQAMIADWHMADHNHALARSAFCTFAGTGALLLAIPSIWTFVEVTLSIFSKVSG